MAFVYVIGKLADFNLKVQHILPRHRCAPTAMRFHRSKHLVVVYADQKIVEFVLKTGKFTKFSKLLSKKLPAKWSLRPFPFCNVTFDPRNDNLLILHDDSVLCVVNKDEMQDQDSEAVDAKVARSSSVGLSDSRDIGDIYSSLQQYPNFHFRKFKHLVHAEWLEGDELVVVEVSPLSLTAKLPPTLKQKTFGV